MRAFLKMRGNVPLEKMKNCRQAAFSYVGVKIAVALLAFYFMPCSSCGNTKSFIIRNILHIAIIGHFISIGLPFAIRVITGIYMAKSFIFLVNFILPINLTVPVPIIGSLHIMEQAKAFNYALFIVVALCCFMVCMLMRAIEELKRLKKEKTCYE